MAKEDKEVSPIIGIVIVVFLLMMILFIVVGGIMWKNDKFDGTIMERLYPAIFFGTMESGAIFLTLGAIFNFDRFPLVPIIGALVVLVIIIITYMLDLINILVATTIVVLGSTMLTILIKWITGKL